MIRTKGLSNRFILVGLSFFLLSVVLLAKNGWGRGDIGYLSIRPGCCSIYFDKYDITILGDDYSGTTYFFLPSYIELSSLDYSNSGLILINDNGEILQHPNINRVERVLVGGDDQKYIPYQVGFFCSENLLTMELEMKDQNMDEISQQAYSPSRIDIISPRGEVLYASDNMLIKGRGNMTWGLEKKPYDIRLEDKISIAGWQLQINGLF